LAARAVAKAYLDRLPAWDRQRAAQLAEQHAIELTDARFELLQAARAFYDRYGFSPSNRPLISTIAERLGLEKGRSIYLQSQFPDSPAKTVALLAGLPKPKNCL
jgi:tRNA 2-thiouridine synthesizing protein E